MKKIMSMLLVLSMLLMGAAMAESETLTMATNAAFPPYEYYDDETGEVTGIDVEIAQAICDKLGYELEVVDVDFDSIVPGVQSGKYSFGMAGMTVTEDRLESVNFSDTYATGVQVVIVPEDSAITSIDDLMTEGADYSVGVQQGTTGDICATEDIEDAGFGTVERFKTGTDAVLALTTGKLDCVIIDNEPAKNFVAANEGLKILDTEYVVEEYAACFAKENTELLDAFNGALAELTEDGTIPAIIEKYIPSTETAEEAPAEEAAAE